MTLRLALIILVASCASKKPTPYQKYDEDKLGYQEREVEGMQVVTFRGNKYTSKNRARRYAEFRAIELCRTEKLHANIVDVQDKTVSKEVLRSSGSTWGPSYFGMYPYYSRYSSFGIGAGFNTIATETWSETVTFPIVEVLFTCANSINRPVLVFREIPAKDLNHLVKDVKGGIQVEQVPKGSPNTDRIEVGDILLKASQKRLERVFELIKLFHSGSEEVETLLLREGEKKVVSIAAKDVTQEVIAEEQVIISKVCKDKKRDNQKQLDKSILCQ